MEATSDGPEGHSERVLSERNEQLKDLVRAISHDLRTPLSVAEGNVRLARETGDLSRLETTSRALVRANELLDHLALLATEEKQIHEPGPTGLREVAEAAWSIAGTDGGVLNVERDVVVSADRQRLQQLLENLFDNAVEHGSTTNRAKPDGAVEHAGTDVTVGVGLLNGKEGFFVEDDGPGIPEDERERVFETGYSYESEGQGLGLAICERIAIAHGWKIEVAGRIGGGTRFEVSNVEVA